MNNNILYNAFINFYKLEKLHPSMTTTQEQNYQIIGVLDTNNKIWYNAWSLYDIDSNLNLYKKSKELLLYALNLQRDVKGLSMVEKIIIRSILVNSKFYILERKTQLYLILAIIMYLVKAKRWGNYQTNNLMWFIVEV